MPEKKLCFVIAPIGDDGSDTRLRSDQVLKHIIKPAAKELDYDTIRADEISEPGIITSQVIQHLLDDPLVVADLTDRNPNVFYELAIRHVVRKPVVQIIQAGQTIPFDVAASRTIFVDHRDLDSVATCREGLVRQIKSVEKNPADVDTPVSVAVDLQSLRASGNPLEKSNAEILDTLQDVRASIAELGASVAGSRRSPLPLQLFERVIINLDGAAEMLDHLETVGGGRPEVSAVVADTRNMLSRAANAFAGLAAESGMTASLVDHCMHIDQRRLRRSRQDSGPQGASDRGPHD